MMDKSRTPRCTPFIVASPLWSRAPAHDEDGKPYSDFMMLIPGLKDQSEAGIESCLVKIRNSLLPFENTVVYVDLNIKLSLLWVSHKPIPGITTPLVHAIQREIPQAKVIAGDFNPDAKTDNQPPRNWLSSVIYKLKGSLKLLGSDKN